MTCVGFLCILFCNHSDGCNMAENLRMPLNNGEWKEEKKFHYIRSMRYRLVSIRCVYLIVHLIKKK